jgi:hypothetical protein
VADSHKRAYEKFKSKKWFFFKKLKRLFTVKLKIIFIDHYFLYHQIPKNDKNIFPKTFYADTNDGE